MSPDEQKIRALIEEWGEASRDGDLIAQMNMVTEDVLFLSAGGAPMRREEFAAGFKSMMENVTLEVRSRVQEITISGDLGVCWNLIEVDITPIEGGDTTKRAGNALTVFRRSADGRWRVWRDANMLTAV